MSKENSVENLIRLTGLDTSEYEHPFDKMSLEALEAIPGIPYCTKKLFEFHLEKLFRIQYSGSYLRVNNRNLPDLYGLFAEACATLDISEIPELYVEWNYSVNAFATGVERPIVAIHSGCIDLLSEKELLFILGHELGHIKSGHVLYKTMGSIFPAIAEQIGELTLGIGGWAGAGVQLSLLHWSRMAELSCDRSGLLTCQDLKACISCMMRMAGLPLRYQSRNLLESFLQQARDFENIDYKELDGFIKYTMSLNLTHPWTVMRASELLSWHESGDYMKVMKRENRENHLSIKSDDKYCANCGNRLYYGENFCGGCGTEINN